MKKIIILLLAALPMLSIGQTKTNDEYFYPTGFTDKDNVFLGDKCAFAIKNGMLWAWESNATGELGDGTQVDQYARYAYLVA